MRPQLPGSDVDYRDVERMRNSARWHIVLFRPKSFLAAVGLSVVFLVATGCDDVKHHETLTFFFDGVPPLPAEMSGDERYDPNADGTARRPTGGWYVHEPLQNCTECHGDRRRRSFSRQVQLVAEVPQLCYRCHDQVVAGEGWVHGPVATGDCLLCHEPHKTKNPFLLTKLAPSLCYECHEPEVVHLVERHAEESYAECTECHEGHAGATKTLLRPAFLQAPAGAAYLRQLQHRQYEEARERARTDLMQGKDILSIFATIIGYVEANELWKIRAYLEVVRESDSITDVEKQKVAEILQRLTAVLEAPSGGGQEAANAEALLDAVCQEALSGIHEMRDRRGQRRRRIAELYYRSIDLYHAGRLAEAREGFLEVLESRPLLEPVRETAESYLQKIGQAP